MLGVKLEYAMYDLGFNRTLYKHCFYLLLSKNNQVINDRTKPRNNPLRARVEKCFCCCGIRSLRILMHVFNLFGKRFNDEKILIMNSAGLVFLLEIPSQPSVRRNKEKHIYSILDKYQYAMGELILKTGILPTFSNAESTTQIWCIIRDLPFLLHQRVLTNDDSDEIRNF